MESTGRKKLELIESYKQKQELHRQAIDDLNCQLQKIHKSILEECEAVRTTTNRLNGKAKEFVSECNASLTQNSKSKHVMDIKDLAAYLKMEKQVLKRLSEKSDVKVENNLDIHQILSKTKLENSLNFLKKKQLEEQIRYLQENVISKGRLIYNAAVAANVSSSEEKELNQKLSNGINELQRVISLTILCNPSEDQSWKLQQLSDQQNRLKDCEGLLANQYQKLGEFLRYFEIESSQFNGKFPLPVYEASDHKYQSFLIEQASVSQSQLDEILSFGLPEGRMVSKLRHCFDDWEQKIQQVKKKYKKLQKRF